VLVVSGADERFHRSLLQLLQSLKRHGYRRCRVYDLGFRSDQRQLLSRRFPWVEVRDWVNPGPPHLSDLGNYGWKPTLIAAELRDEPLLWLDSACVVTGSLQRVQDELQRWGWWVPWAGRGPVREMTYPAVSEALQLPPEFLGGRFRAGGVCAFLPTARSLVEDWRNLAWREEVLAPAGSHRGNHRFDQVLLSFLLHGQPGTDDEIDISSPRPVPFLRTRNKLRSDWPLWADPLSRAYFALRRWLDVTAWKFRAS
jgi:hypothetical protein